MNQTQNEKMNKLSNTFFSFANKSALTTTVGLNSLSLPPI